MQPSKWTAEQLAQWTPEQLEKGERIQKRFEQAAGQARRRLAAKAEKAQPSSIPPFEGSGGFTPEPDFSCIF
jgi:hypothetical protein